MHMRQVSDLKRKDLSELFEEDNKEVYAYITTLIKKRLKASKKSKRYMLIHLRSGETITYFLSDIDNISYT